MKVRIIAVLLANACATWLPALAQQPNAPTQSAPTQAAPKAPAPAFPEATKSCCGGSCDMAKPGENSASAEHHHADCCAGKDPKAMSCCQSQGKDAKSAMACCDKDDKNKDAKSAMDCCKGHGSEMCVAKGDKSCCDAVNMAEHCKARANGR
jgi:hypothetical protein